MQSPPLLRTKLTLSRIMLSNSNPRFPFPMKPTSEFPPQIPLSNLKISTNSSSDSKTFSTVSSSNLCSNNSNSSRLNLNLNESRTLEGEVEVEIGDFGMMKSTLVVVSFYKFADLVDYGELRKPLKNLCEELRVSGGIILAPEGINGSICGTRESVDRVLGFIQSDERLKGLRQIESPVTPEEEEIHHGHTSSSPLAAGEDAPFRWDHVRVKLKKEIVSLGLPTISPNERVGKYVNPRDWNDLINDPDTVVIDVRNTYETRIGKFKGAVDPRTKAFRDFPSWVDDNLQVATPNDEQSKGEIEDISESTIEQPEIQEQKKPTKVAMYCTGGIRCEKASSFLLNQGFEEVYHLKGGILKYLEEVPRAESLWEGECFVFDKRVSVEHGLAPGTFKLCYGCKQPVSDADMEAPEWERGVTCPYCFSTKSEEEKDRARARQKQFAEWGIIGGPDKGRKPTVSKGDKPSKSVQLSSSI